MAKRIDPFLNPAFSVQNRLGRLIWGLVQATIFAYSPRPFHSFRSFLLRCFGAQIGPHCHVYPGASIWAPWNLKCADFVTIADGATIYNADIVVLESHVIISQDAYLCGATHDYDSVDFPLVALPINIGPYAWVCARAVVQAGVNVGEGAVLALGGVATRQLDEWTVYGGVPAKKIKARLRNHIDGSTSPVNSPTR